MKIELGNAFADGNAITTETECIKFFAISNTDITVTLNDGKVKELHYSFKPDFDADIKKLAAAGVRLMPPPGGRGGFFHSEELAKTGKAMIKKALKEHKKC